MSDEIIFNATNTLIVGAQIDYVSSNSMLLSVISLNSIDCVSWQYSLNSGTTWKSLPSQYLNEISGLTINTTYKVKVRAKRTASSAYVVSNLQNVTTCQDSKLNSVNTYSVDNNGDTLTVNCTVNQSNVKHQLDIIDGSTTILTLSNLIFPVGTNSQNINLTETQRNTIMRYMSNKASMSAEFKLTTYSPEEILVGGSNAVDKTKTALIQLSSEFSAPIPSFCAQDYNSLTLNKTNDNQLFIGEASKIRILTADLTGETIIPTQARNFASIVSYTVSINGITTDFYVKDRHQYDEDYEEQYQLYDGEIYQKTDGNISYDLLYCGSLQKHGISGGNVYVELAVTDSRGFSTHSGIYIQVLEYKYPSISKLNVARFNGAGTTMSISMSGSVYPLTINGNVISNITAKLHYREWNDTRWGDYITLNVSIDTNNVVAFNTNALLSTGESVHILTSEHTSYLIKFDDNKIFDVEVELSDSLFYDSKVARLPISKVLMALRDGKVGINKIKPEAPFDVDGDIHSTGTVETNLKKDGTFAAIKHYCKNYFHDSDKLIAETVSIAFGCGSIPRSINTNNGKKDVTYPTLSLELMPPKPLDRDLTYQDAYARFDVFESIEPDTLICIRGSKKGVFSSILELGQGLMRFDGDCYSKSIKLSSTENIKENIEASESVLDIFSQSNIYKYNYKHVPNEIIVDNSKVENGEFNLDSVNVLNLEETKTGEKKSYGFVIGDSYNTPPEVMSKDGKHIDLYSMAALNWKATQELLAKITALENEIAQLKSREVNSNEHIETANS